MGHPQALATFPGVEQIDSVSSTLSLGITPGVHRLVIAPQQRFVGLQGDLTLTFGGQKVATLKDCLVDSGSYEFNQSGYLVTFNILDRRWKWRYPVVSGRYNVRTGDGQKIVNGEGANEKADAITNTERTPQQLATICLKAMKEEGYDVSKLPNDARPEVLWDLDNAAEALDQLCAAAGCRVCLTLDNKVKIVRLGDGDAMPNGPIESDNLIADPPEKPDIIAVATGPITHQADLELEAVGLDTDGEYKLLEDLSYYPGSIAKYDVPGMFNITDAASRKLALESVFRCYRVKVPATIPTHRDTKEKIEKLDQILPLGTKQVEINATTKVRLDAIVYGVYWGEFIGGITNSATELTPYPSDRTADVQLYGKPFTIDADRGIVRFSDPVYRNTTPTGSSVTVGAAQLRLRTSVFVRSKETGMPIRYARTKKPPGKEMKTEPRIIKRDDIFAATIPIYGGGFKVDRLLSNFARGVAVDSECDYYLNAAIKELEIETPQVRTFAGLWPYGPDGALQSITWTIDGERGGTTIVQRNQDLGSPTTLPFNTRSFYQTAGSALSKVFAAGGKAILKAKLDGVK